MGRKCIFNAAFLIVGFVVAACSSGGDATGTNGTDAGTASDAAIVKYVSSYTLCLRTCDANYQCGVLPGAGNSACVNDCTQMRSDLDAQDGGNDRNCSNALSVRNQDDACLLLACDKINACIAAIDRVCIPK